MKKIFAIALTGLFSFNVYALPISGFSRVKNLGGGVYEYIFDRLPADIISADGLTFSGAGSPLLTVTGSGDVIQDTVGANPVTAHGGLGVNGGPGGDNLAAGDPGEEWLNFSLGGTLFDVVDFTLNGDHSPNASGDFIYGYLNVGIAAKAEYNDTTDDLTRYFVDGQTGIFDNQFTTDRTDFRIYSADVDSYPGGSWSGYFESIKIRIDKVPEPSIIALFAAGLLGMGFARRRKAA